MRHAPCAKSRKTSDREAKPFDKLGADGGSMAFALLSKSLVSDLGVSQMREKVGDFKDVDIPLQCVYKPLL